jgi:hypothetical protein
MTFYKTKGTVISQTNFVSFNHDYQSNESLNDHFSDNFHTCSSSYVSGFDLKENSQGSECEIIYDSDLEVEDSKALHPQVMVMSGPCIVNPHDQSKFQDVGYPFTDHISIDSHLESSHNDFNFKEINSMPIFDSYDITQVPTSFHNLEFLTQVDASSNIDYTIGVDTCEKETLVISP